MVTCLGQKIYSKIAGWSQLWFFAVFFAIAVVHRLSIYFLDSKKMDFLRVHLLLYFKGRPKKPHILIDVGSLFPTSEAARSKANQRKTLLHPQEQSKPPNPTPMQNQTQNLPLQKFNQHIILIPMKIVVEMMMIQKRTSLLSCPRAMPLIHHQTWLLKNPRTLQVRRRKKSITGGGTFHDSRVQ